MINRRRWIGSALLVFALAGCATAPQSSASLPPVSAQARTELAPTGVLRVGVYAGSPSSMVVLPTGERTGVAYRLGQALAQTLAVPFQPQEYRRLAEVIEALQRGEIDVTFTNASAARAQVMAFTQPLISLELGYLLAPGSAISQLAQIDQPGRRIGVSQGSTSQGTLGRLYVHAELVPQPTLPAAAQQLSRGQIDAFATNKGILHELADGLPGARLLEGRWGLEHMALGMPLGRPAGLACLNQFAQQVRADGRLQAFVQQSGLRGTVPTPVGSAD